MTNEESKFPNAFKAGRSPAESLSHNIGTRFRDDLVDGALSALKKGQSLLIVGDEGAGKSAVIAELDRRLQQTTKHRIKSFSSNEIQAGCVWVGEWQSKLDQILQEAVRTKTILFFRDIWNFPEAGTGTDKKSGFWDLVQPYVERAGGLQVIGEVNPSILGALSADSAFMKPFSILRVPILSAEEKTEILLKYSASLSLNCDKAIVDSILKLCGLFWPNQKGLATPLRILDMIDRSANSDLDRFDKVRTPSADQVEAVFSELTGLPDFIISPSRMMRTREIKEWFRERIIGQEEALDAVVESIALFKAGMHDPSKPIGSFLFVGPSGVGKTELAKALAAFLFGSEDRLLRFDLSEFAQYDSYELLIGSAGTPPKPARLLEPVQANPFQVILLDEIEKGHFNIRDIMLQLLDEGTVSPPKGPAVDFRNTIVIATSNVGSSAAQKATPGFGQPIDGAYDLDKAHQDLTAAFRPEFLNRFQHVVQFHPLTPQQAEKIGKIELRKILRREGLVNRSVAVNVDDEVIASVVAAGYDPRYGGRDLKRLIQKRIVLPIALTLMERAPSHGSVLTVSMRDNDIAVSVIEEDNDQPTELKDRSNKVPLHQRISRDEIPAKLQEIGDLIASLSQSANELQMRDTVDAINKERDAPDFWKNAELASSRLALQTRYAEYLKSIDRLRDDLHTLANGRKRPTQKTALNKWAFDYTRLKRQHIRTHRKLVTIGIDKDCDAYIELAPINASADDLRFLFRIYSEWCTWNNFRLRMIHEPRQPDQPVAFVISGPFAYGFLSLENGIHRLRHADGQNNTIRCKVTIWNEDSSGVEHPKSSKVLKETGILGGRLRSRVEANNGKTVLQNGQSIFENSELIGSVIDSQQSMRSPSDENIRRYDMNPFLVRDHLSKINTGNRKGIGPALFHDLLCERVDQSVE